MSNCVITWEDVVVDHVVDFGKIFLSWSVPSYGHLRSLQVIM